MVDVTNTSVVIPFIGKIIFTVMMTSITALKSVLTNPSHNDPLETKMIMTHISENWMSLEAMQRFIKPIVRSERPIAAGVEQTSIV